jgi:hypothetical protein
MDEAEGSRDVTVVTLLVGAVTGQQELSEDDRRAVAEWAVDRAEIPEVRDLLIKIVGTQIIATTEWRVKLAEALREKFGQEPQAVNGTSDKDES